MSEIPSTGLLILASIALARGFSKRSTPLYVVSSLLFGVLALIKAVVMYGFLGGLVGLIIAYWLQRPKPVLLPVVRALLALLIPFACIVTPWMVRNHMLLGTFEITQRAGQSMYERSLLDQMTPLEHAGAYYLWAPYFAKTLGKAFDFSHDDLLPGGRLERLDADPDSPLSQKDLIAEEAGSPDDTVTIFRRARAERVKIQDELTRSGHPHSDVRGDEMLKESALATFLDHPLKHLAITPLFLWRGAADSTPVLLIALVVALKLRRYDLALFVLPILGIVAIYALFTPYFPRYGVPAHLIAIIVVVVLAKAVWDAVAARRAKN
jgi:hypothetical protein